MLARVWTRRRASGATLLGWIVVTALAPVRAARAQEDEYRAIISEAVAEFDAFRFAEARTLFRRAHAIRPSARTLRGIGLSSFELRDYVEAYRTLSAALVDPRRPLAADQAEAVRGILARTRTFVGIYRISPRLDALDLRVDGDRATLEPDGTLILGLGRHTVTARPAERRESSVTVVVGGGEEDELTFELAPEDAQSSSRLDAPRERTETTEPPRRASDPVPAITLLVIGGALGAASLATGLGWWLFQDGEARACRRDADCDNIDAIVGARDAAIATTLPLAITGAALIVTGAILVASPSGSDRAELRCAPAGAGVACAGVF